MYMGTVNLELRFNYPKREKTTLCETRVIYMYRFTGLLVRDVDLMSASETHREF
jgi:hypothetical protein